MSKIRISWIDICRGIGILCVIYAHGLGADKFRYLFYAFHIPLFFFLSGVTFHHKNHESLQRNLKKSVRSILIPYTLSAVICYGLWLIFNPRGLSIPNLTQAFINILYGSGAKSQYFYNAVLWFLPCLFATRILFTLTSKYITKTKLLGLALLLFSISGYILSIYYPHLKMPFGLETALSSVVFFGLGYIYNSRQDLKKILESRKSLFTILFLLLTLITATLNFHLFGHQVDMRLNHLGNYFLFYLSALSGISMCISLSYAIKENSLLQFLGRNSMILFVSHLVIFSYISKILFIWITPATVAHFRNLYFAPLYSIISIIIISAVLKIYQNLSIIKLRGKSI